MQDNTTDTITEFSDAIVGAGLPAPERVVADGELHRFSTNGKSGDDSGWYVLNHIGAGAFGCWRSGIKCTWSTKATNKRPRDEQVKIKRRMREAARRGRAERKKRNADAAVIAQQAWQGAKPAPAEHPYLQKKQVQPNGLRIDDDGQLLVPMAVDGDLVSLQLIDDSGDKCFIPQGKTKGASCTLGTPNGALYIAEGFATAATIRETTGAAAVVAFNAGNLLAVAKAVRARYPDADLVIAADNDCENDTNVGLDAAKAAAAAVGATYVLPYLDGAACDFNDIHVAHGLDAVRAQLKTDDDTAQLFAPPPPELAKLPRILDQFKATIADAVAGESGNACILYLALTSRLLNEPVSIAVKGNSSSGKSYTVGKTIRFFPDEAVVEMTAMSERVLIYSEDEYAHRTILMLEASGLQDEESMQAYLLRTLLSEGKITYQCTVKGEDGQYTAVKIEKSGPTNLILTTTKDQIHRENETRMLSLMTDDSSDQTRRIFKSIADEERHEFNRQPWLELQAWLEIYGNRRVTIPYRYALSELFSTSAIRLRRDFGHVLALIRSHAILQQYSRDTDDRGRIIADMDDYVIVHQLVAGAIGEAVGVTVSDTVRETVGIVETYATDDGITAKRIGEYLNLDKSAAGRRLRKAANGGYIRNMEERRGRPGRWVTDEPLPGQEQVLPTPAAVAERLQAGCDGGSNQQPIETKNKSGSGCTVDPVAREVEGKEQDNEFIV